MFPVSYANGIRGQSKHAYLSVGRAGFNVHEADQPESKVICRIRTTIGSCTGKLYSSLNLGLEIIGKSTPYELAASDEFWKLVRIAEIARDDAESAATAAVKGNTNAAH